VTAVADVRSYPSSRHFPHFNKSTLKTKLAKDGISYVFLGKELGGRPTDLSLYSDGVADYEKMALANDFNKGILRILEGANSYSIAIMCSEHDPLDCHRCLLVARALTLHNVKIHHILINGQIASHSAIEDRLLAWLERTEASQNDLFASREQRLQAAYRARSNKVAFNEPTSSDNSFAMPERYRV
jgi:uncharacterized protein (DUF488 family)